MKFLRLIAAILLINGCLLSCSQGEHDAELRAIIVQKKLTGPFFADLTASSEKKQIAELGADLFFSPDLSIDGSVSCASCHHPGKAGADGISLPIGIGGLDSKNVGEDRIAAAGKNTKANIAEGLIPRNSPTVFNSSLYRKNLFWDGRAQYIKTDNNGDVVKVGFGVSPLSPTPYEQKSLLQTQARMPLSSLFEMKGSLEPDKNNHEIEQSIIEFLQSKPVWCEKFIKAFNGEECKKTLTLATLTEALAEFQATLIFTDSPFEQYIQGNKKALNNMQKQGALLFYKELKEGGLGCSYCHANKHITDENFYNIGIPASGRGANENGMDFGRNNVDVTAPRFSFRTPSLLNVAATAPYFHNGTALTLREAIKFHVFNESLEKQIKIVALPSINYPQVNTLIESEFKQQQETIKLLPKKITEEQLNQLVAFLESLTDQCVLDEKCIDAFSRPIIESERLSKTPEINHTTQNNIRKLDVSLIKKPNIECKKNTQHEKKGEFLFVPHSKDIGINHIRSVGMINMGWLLDVVNYGGVSVVDVDYDCLDDIIFDAGDRGFVFYKQGLDGTFKNKSLPLDVSKNAISPLIMDVDGDYKFDLFVGSSGKGFSHIAFDFLHKKDLMYFNALNGPVINASIADIDLDGDIDMAFAFWRSYKSLQQDHIWINDGAANFEPHSKRLDLRSSNNNITNTNNDLIRRKHQTLLSESDLTFTPNFVDIDNDSDADLLLASDFNRSQILRNDDGQFIDITDKNEINDNNGMGSAIADFSNKGSLDWYVTSIYRGNSAARTGNHFYKNNGQGEFVKDIKATPQPDNEEWSWGACAADFNNDGYVDIFYISGFGEMLTTAKYQTATQKIASEDFLASNKMFSQSKPHLLLNNGDGTFKDVSNVVGLTEAYDGRGVGCFDYQQDGDIDIIVNPVEGTPRLYVNKINGAKNWIAIRLLGLPGNAEALGSKIYVHTNKGIQYREVRFENNYLSRNPSQVHFGLGDINNIEKIEIVFPAPHKKQLIIKAPEINKLHIIQQ